MPRPGAAPSKTSGKPRKKTRAPLTALVVDDEEVVLAQLRHMLEPFGVTVLPATSTAEAFRVLNSARADVAFVDWRLGGHDDGLALGRALRRDHGIPFVLFSSFLNTDATGHAYRGGAADVVDKPLRTGRLLAAIEFALARGARSIRRPDSDAGSEAGWDSVTHRWAALVLRACHAQKDPRTEAAVARAAGVSTSGFCKTCDGCSVSPRATRDLVRFLRALSRAKEDNSMVRSHLEVTDPRTRQELFARAGLPLDAGFVPLRSFMLNQKFVRCSHECLRELAHRAVHDPLFFVDFESEDQPHGTKRA